MVNLGLGLGFRLGLGLGLVSWVGELLHHCRQRLCMV